MPELPEVETIRLGLEKYLVGKIILDLEIKDSKISLAKEHLLGAKINKIERFGKGLVFEFDNGYSLAIHIKLTGQFIYQDEVTHGIKLSSEVSSVPNKFTRIIFGLSGNAKLYFNDIRRFAWFKLVKTSEVQNLPFFKELGPEPPAGQVSTRATLTFTDFAKIVGKSNGAIKTLLLDQKKIGGVGNIYANDALFLAKIDPRRQASSLNPSEIKKLYEAIIEVLKRGLKYKGATEINFVNVLGQEGGYQDYFLVYSREGEKCKVCGNTIRKIKLAGRGTYFCAKCQR